MVFDLGHIRLTSIGEDIAIPIVKDESKIESYFEKLRANVRDSSKKFLKKYAIFLKEKMMEKNLKMIVTEGTSRSYLKSSFEADEFLFTVTFPEFFRADPFLLTGLKEEYIDVISMIMPNKDKFLYSAKPLVVVRITKEKKEIIAISEAEGSCLKRIYETIGISNQKMLDFFMSGPPEIGKRGNVIGSIEKKFGRYDVNITVYQTGIAWEFSNTDKYNVSEAINMRKLGLSSSIVRMTGSVRNMASKMVCMSDELTISRPYVAMCIMAGSDYVIRGTEIKDINDDNENIDRLMSELEINLEPSRAFFIMSYGKFMENPTEKLSVTGWFEKSMIIFRFYGNSDVKNDVYDDISFDILMARSRNEMMSNLMRKVNKDGSFDTRGNVLCRAMIKSELD